MYEYILPLFDKTHFFIYNLLIKANGYTDETEFKDIYVLYFIQFVSCIIMSALIVSPCFLIIVSGYFIYQKRRTITKKYEMKENEIEPALMNERIVHVTNETITKRFENSKKEKNSPEKDINENSEKMKKQEINEKNEKKKNKAKKKTL